jgi:hypothetical protein
MERLVAACRDANLHNESGCTALLIAARKWA